MGRPSLLEVFCKRETLKGFRKIHKKNPATDSRFLIKLQTSGLHLLKRDSLHLLNLIRKRLLHRSFPVNCANFFKSISLTKHLWWLLLNRLIVKNTLRENCPCSEFFWPAFSTFLTEYGVIPYSNRMRKKCGPEKLRIRMFFTQ